MATPPAELVLLILWARGREHHERLARKIFDSFHPLIIREVDWAADARRERLSELYGRPADSLFDKENEIGEGPFTVVVAVDHRPRHTQSKRAQSIANRKAYRMKMRERRGEVNYLHASDTEEDAIAFATRLLDVSPEYLLDLKRASVAARPVQDLKDLFRVMNEADVSYAVLRNWQDLPDGLTPGHGDVDILVNDPAKVLALFPDIRKKHTDPRRVHWFVPLSRRRSLYTRKHYIRFDIRFVGDDYYDANWQRDMIDRRVLSDKGFYHLASADHFWSLLYHALLHKPAVSEDYRRTLSELGAGIEGWSDELIDDPNRAREFLAAHVPITRPKDPSVYWYADARSAH